MVDNARLYALGHASVGQPVDGGAPAPLNPWLSRFFGICLIHRNHLIPLI
jgi:hypothetical protein